MATDLASLQARVQQVLADTGAAIWTVADLTEALRQALSEYSEARPYEAATTLTLAYSGREISIASVTGLLDVLAVWCPYTAASPEDPPNLRPFTLSFDRQIIYISGAYVPAAGDVLRLFYTKAQTLDDLDGATVTTFSTESDSLIVTGAAGFAATSRAVDLAEGIALDAVRAQTVRAWGLSKLQDFRAGLRRISKREAGHNSSRVTLPPLDDYDRPRGSGGKSWS